VYSPIDLADFKTLILPYVRRRKRGGGRYMGYEYHFPFHGVISATIAHLIEAGVKGDVVDFFFDEQGKVGKWARDLYDEMKARTASAEIRPYLGACTHRDDRDLVALQAADLFASRVRVWDESDPVLCILGRIPCKVSYWPQTRLKDFIATALPEVRGDNQ
jgi:hypothetical protein